jgi:hypothetical protein
VVRLIGKLRFSGDQPERCEPIEATMRFSLSVDPHSDHLDMEGKKLRIEDFFGSDGELVWNILPDGLDDHLELTLHFLYVPGSNLLFEYGSRVLGIITGKSLAAWRMKGSEKKGESRPPQRRALFLRVGTFMFFKEIKQREKDWGHQHDSGVSLRRLGFLARYPN